MTLLEQCQLWHEADEHQKIVDALEGIPTDACTPEIDLELARAYNNLANPEEPQGRALLKRAIARMAPHRDTLEGDYSWNFRMGYAYYYLDQEGPALAHFQRALTLHPGDDPKYNTAAEIRELIDDCRRRLSLPRFETTFRERTMQAWQAFVREEKDLRRIMDEDKDHQRGEELIALCRLALNIAFDDLSFELGFNGEKYELILTPEGDRVKLFEMVYFQRQAPASLAEQWNILVGRRPAAGFTIGFGGWEVSAQDVTCQIEKLDEGHVGLILYCEKLLPLLQKKENQAWWMLLTLTDQVLGEIPHMAYVDSFDVAHTPLKESCLSMTALPRALEEMGLALNLDPQAYLNSSYTGYQLQPQENPECGRREDVYIGVTRCTPLLEEYYSGDRENMDLLHRDGAAAGFLCYPLDPFTGQTRGKDILDFREALEQAILQTAGAESVTFLGGATGLACGYLDFVAWDLMAVLEAAQAFLQKSPLQWASFQTFRQEAQPVTLLDRRQKDTPHTPARRAAFH